MYERITSILSSAYEIKESKDVSKQLQESAKIFSVSIQHLEKTIQRFLEEMEAKKEKTTASDLREACDHLFDEWKKTRKLIKAKMRQQYLYTRVYIKILLRREKMNKKILAVSILAVLMLVTISFASAISTNTTPTRKKETPLFGIRTRSAIEERLQNLKENIKARFIGERLFFLPFQLLKNVNDPYMARTMTSKSGTLCTEYSICNICN